MPPADRKALEEMPDIVHDTPEAAGTFTSKGPEAVGPEDAGGDVFGQDRRQPGWQGDPPRRLPGAAGERRQGRVTEFFLVPYPGACIHVPPPPPNQIVLVRYPQGLKLTDIYTPLWVSGTLKIESR